MKPQNEDFYFLSENPDLGGTFLVPRVPENFMTRNGYEDNNTPRVCFAPSIDKALMALSHRCGNKIFHVYKPADVSHNKIHHPTKHQVPDVNITDEVWFLKKTRIRYVGSIIVKDERAGSDYTYNEGKNKVTLWSWNWEWVSHV